MDAGPQETRTDDEVAEVLAGISFVRRGFVAHVS
jgi:hypothetical protein